MRDPVSVHDDAAAAPPRLTYGQEARAPIHILILLVPLALLVEIGGVLLRPAGGPPAGTQVARSLIEALVAPLGIVGNWIPPVALTATLIWLAHRSARWRPRPLTPVLMVGESLLAAVPLLVLAALMGGLLAGPAWPARLLDVIGAGIYEELVFRLYAVSLLVFLIGVIAPRCAGPPAELTAIVVSALVFSALHFEPFGGQPYAALPLIARTLAGCYLGYLFLLRGLGIAAGAHATYNAVLLLAG